MSAAQSIGGADRLMLSISLFETSKPNGPAYGRTQRMTWGAFSSLFRQRRQGDKDGANFIPATFRPDPGAPGAGGVRRVKGALLARTAVALDCETNKESGVVPPPMADVVKRVQAMGLAAVVYTSHSHQPGAPRYRVVMPLSEEIDPALPAAEALATVLGLGDVLDEGKVGAASLFYFPSAHPGKLAHHEAVEIPGRPIEAAWMRERAGVILAAREAEEAKQRAEAMEEAARRREERIAQGFDPNSRIIEAVRDRLDLEELLLRRGYARKGKGKYLYPDSETGQPGVHVLRGRDGVMRAYSHHSADPLAAGNLPAWCRAKAVDAVDVVAILEFGGDLTAALRSLAQQFGINSPRRDGQAQGDPGPQPREGDATTAGAEEPAQDGEAPRGPKVGAALWPDPIDFLGDGQLTGIPKLLPRHLPDALAPFCFDTAARMGVDPAAVALAAVVSCASVASDEWAIQPKVHDDTWTESARLWGAVVGDPSILKTPVLKACTKPIDRLEADARDRHSNAMRMWKAQVALLKKDKVPPEGWPAQPRLDRYMVEGTTTEALTEVLRDDDEAKQRAPSGKVLCRQDEMSGWIGDMDRYKAGGKGGGDRAAYLTLFNGGRYTVDRIGRGSFAVSNWSACVLGGIQPEPIQRIAKEAADDGLLQRFLYCVPAGQRDGEDRQPDRGAQERYAALFPALAALRPTSGAFDEGVRAVVLSEGAHRHRLAVDDLVKAHSAMPDTSPRLKAAFGKFRGIFARLALTFHLIDLADANARGFVQPPVAAVLSEQTAGKAAAYLRDVLLPHLLRAEALLFLTPQAGHARWIAGYILANKAARETGRVTLRDVTRAYSPLKPPECRDELLKVMTTLEVMGWIASEIRANPAQPPAGWSVNPKVHEVFAEAAKAERERRDRAQAEMAELIRRTMAERTQ